MPILNVSHAILLETVHDTKRMVLVSNTGDETMLDHVFEDLVLDARIDAIRVNNVPLTFQGHEKVQFVPIGFCQDEYLYKPLGRYFIVQIRLQNIPWVKTFIKNHPSVNVLEVTPKQKLGNKKRKVICAISNTGSEWTVPDLRRRCKEHLAKQDFGHVLPFMCKEKYFEEHETHAFEVSPFGNGLDCFRTYEALLLHTIPIVFDSPINIMFKGLPVIIVKEVEDITAELLEQAMDTYGSYFDTHDIRKELSLRKWWPSA